MNRTLTIAAGLLMAFALPAVAVAQSPSASPLTLTLAIANDQGEPSQPAIDAFIAQVAKLSDGSIAIDPLYGAGNATPEGFEAGVAGLVERGDADLALNASRAWDLEGVTSLQALQAPFLITDGALATAVATSDIATRALAGMADAGVTGLTLWPEDLRHPFALGTHAPFMTPDDFKGANILVQPSALSRSLITTLGGTLYVDGDRDADAAAGILQGAESGLLQGATLPGHPTATGDVTFYPKFQVISANPARFAALTPEQQAILRAAAAETQRQTIAAHASEADAAAAWCANGGAVVLAGPAGVAAFEAAAKPVFEAISKDPLTAQLITDIQALKATTTPAPGATACNAVAASPTSVPSESSSADASPVEFLWSATGGPDGMKFPNDMALDPQGRLWVADTGNSRFAIFNPDGTFVEYWGSRGKGDGEFQLEQENGGFGAIAFAPDGSFYVLDVGNKRVQHFGRDRGFLGAWGSVGTGPGQYSEPIGLAVGPDGTVYVLDDRRGVVERYGPDGTVLGAVNAYPGATAAAHDISGAAFTIDGNGDLYTSTTRPAGPSQVQRLDPSGMLAMTFGSVGNEPGQFSDQPSGAAVDAEGRLFVTQGPTGNGANVQVFGPDGAYLAGWRVADASGTTFNFPFGILLDGVGNVYVADAGANRVDKFALLPPFTPTAEASPSASPPVSVLDPFTVVQTLDQATTGLVQPEALAVGPDGYLYVVDFQTSIRVISPSGQPIRSWGKFGTGPGEFNFNGLASIAVGADGLVYVLDRANRRVQVFEPNGKFVRQVGSFGDKPGQFVDPSHVAVDRHGNIFVIDDAQESLTKFDATGAVAWTIGGSGETDPDLVGHYHRGSFDSRGRLWLTNDNNSRVVAINERGKKVDAFGEQGTGPGQFEGTMSVAFDASDNAYVDECSSKRLQVLDPRHQVIGVLSAPGGLPFGESYAFGPDGLLYAVVAGDHCAGALPPGSAAGDILVMKVKLPPSA